MPWKGMSSYLKKPRTSSGTLNRALLKVSMLAKRSRAVDSMGLNSKQAYTPLEATLRLQCPRCT